MKKKIIPIAIVAGLILVILGVTLAFKLIEKYTPSKEVMLLTEQYAVTSDNEVPIIYNQELLDIKGLKVEDEVFVDFDFVHDNLNPRFFWDNNENLLLYTTARDLITVNAESSSYLVNKSSTDFGEMIVKVTSNNTYINVKFLKEYSDFEYDYIDDSDCSRLIITNEYRDYDTIAVKKDTQIRVLGGIKSPILSEVSKGDVLYLLADYEDWKQVMTKDGIIGFVKTKALGSTASETIASSYVPESYEHIKKDFDINMIWHQVTTSAANSNIAAVLSSTKGVNVVSPTWFYLNDNNGNLHDIGSTTYVNYCHQQGVEVWALFSNIENSDVDTTYVLTHTSSRQNLVNQIVSMAIQYNLDGVNIDFEAMSKEGVGDAFIQFIRELSLKCANNAIVLSVDNYVPTEYTSFYHRDEQAKYADYLVIMGYDEHFKGSEPGSISSIPWLNQGVQDTLAEVPSDQVILGLPFYNRIWMVTESTATEGAYVEPTVECYSVGMDEAISMIKRNNATVSWSEELGQSYAEFPVDNTTYKIWLEDSEALTRKLEVVNNHNLAGASFWKAGLESAEVWDIIIKYLD